MEMYDVIIIGAGGAGLAAGMYAGRLGLKTLVFGWTSSVELPVGGVITTTHVVENYPGFKSISGVDLAKNLEEHAREYGIGIKEEWVKTIKKQGDCFFILTDKGEYQSKAVIYAAGTKWRTLDVPGEKEFGGKGVSYCALCDGPLFKGKTVAVVGGSDSAAKEALLLSEYASKVYLIVRSKVRAEPINSQRIKDNKKIEVLEGMQIKEIRGDKFVTHVMLDKDYHGSKELKLDGVFVAIGHIALSALAKEAGAHVNEKGEIVIDKESRTNVEGFFACGDVTDSEFKQLVVGVAEGVKAAYHAYKHVSGKEFCPKE